MSEPTSDLTDAGVVPESVTVAVAPQTKRRAPRWLLPALLIVGALLALNLGLYFRLATGAGSANCLRRQHPLYPTHPPLMKWRRVRRQWVHRWRLSLPTHRRRQR